MSDLTVALWRACPPLSRPPPSPLPCMVVQRRRTPRRRLGPRDRAGSSLSGLHLLCHPAPRMPSTSSASAAGLQLDAFLAQSARGVEAAERRGRRQWKEKRWTGDGEDEGEADGVDDEGKGGEVGVAAEDAAEQAEDSGDDDDVDEAGLGVEGGGEGGAGVGGGAGVVRRTRDWEAIHRQRWLSAQGVDAEEGAELDAPRASSLSFRSTRKRRRGVDGEQPQPTSLKADEAEEEAERQRRMRLLFDRRGEEKLEPFTADTSSRGRADRPHFDAAEEEEEVEDAGPARASRASDPWWAEQRTAAAAAKLSGATQAERDTSAASLAASPSPSASVPSLSSVQRRPVPSRPSATPFILRPWSEVEAKRLLLSLLQPGESVTAALRRLGTSHRPKYPHPPPQVRVPSRQTQHPACTVHYTLACWHCHSHPHSHPVSMPSFVTDAGALTSFTASLSSASLLCPPSAESSEEPPHQTQRCCSTCSNSRGQQGQGSFRSGSSSSSTGSCGRCRRGGSRAPLRSALWRFLLCCICQCGVC